MCAIFLQILSLFCANQLLANENISIQRLQQQQKLKQIIKMMETRAALSMRRLLSFSPSEMPIGLHKIAFSV